MTMKTFSKNLICLVFSLLMLLSLLPQQAWAAGSSLSASASTLRPGNSFSIYVNISGSNILGVEGSLSYDSSTLSFNGMESNMNGSWSMSQSGSYFTMYNTDESSPINGSKTVMVLYFSVKSGAAPGASMSVSVSGLASSGASESSFGASWSNTVAAPLSGNANLDDLWCSNAELNFTGGTEYNLTVPYSVSSLSLDWDRAHSGASVAVSGNSLSVGSNTVTVTVTAENGNTKRYYIYVTRQQDPNYVPSSDATLSALSVSTGTLSPAFSPDITEYVVYLANEQTQLSLSGTARDSKAKGVRQVGSSNLMDGETLLMLRVTAEDDTMMDYKVHVIRMPAYSGVLPEIIPPETEVLAPTEPLPPAEPEPEPEPVITLEIPQKITLPYVGDVEIWWIGGAAVLLVLLLMWLLAWAIGRRSGRRKAMRQMAEYQSNVPDAPLLDRLAAAEAAQAAEEEAEHSEESAEAQEGSSAEDTCTQEESPAAEDEQEEAAQEVSAAGEKPSVEEAAGESLPLKKPLPKSLPLKTIPPRTAKSRKQKMNRKASRKRLLRLKPNRRMNRKRTPLPTFPPSRKQRRRQRRRQRRKQRRRQRRKQRRRRRSAKSSPLHRSTSSKRWRPSPRRAASLLLQSKQMMS